MKDVVWACDVETLRFTYISPSITGLLGWTSEEFLAAPVLTHFTVKSAQRAMHAIAQGLEEFSAGADSGEQPPERRYYSEELEGLHKDGSIVWLEVIAFLHRNDSSGRLEMHGVSRDIGERKRAEAALRASELRLQLAAHAAGLGVWHWRIADDYLEWDERMCEMYAVPEHERTARLYYATWRSRLHPDDRERAERTAMEALRTASEWDCTFRIVLPDGAIRHIHGAAVIEYDDAGAPLRMVGINQDISQQKVYEQMLEEANSKLEREVAARTADLRATVNELQAANAGKDAFLTAISHELRTPLMGVLGMAELLGAEMRGPLNSGQARYVAAITESGRRLLDIVNNLLMYTQLMSGRTTLVRTPCGLADLCAAAVHATQPRAERKRHSITQKVQPASLTIESDPDRIVNLLKLLLDNAVKFTPDGGQITVEIGAGPADDTVQIVVTDTGIGMTPEEVVHLFRPFVQADGSLARRFEGMGIGLAIVYKVVELLGGAIGVESELGQGSRFIVTLPHGDA
jgi:PAS domain S-box-containing protein